MGSLGWFPKLAQTFISQARAQQIGVPRMTIDLLIAGSLNTLGNYAYCCGYQPNATDETPLVEALTKVLGAGFQLTSPLRRLFYEAHTLSLIEMRSQMEARDGDTPRKLQIPERAHRMEQLRARYPGLLIRGEFEFSYALLDKVIDQFSRNELRYIPLEECTRRQQELDGVRKDDVLRIDIKNDDSLKLGRELVSEKAKLATDLEIRNAFVRRALAYDAADLLTYSVHETWINTLFRRMQEPAVEDHHPISIRQVYRADRRLWIRMAEETVANILPMPGSVRPLDAAMLALRSDVEVTFLLLPLQKSSSHSTTSMPSSSVPEQQQYGPPKAQAKNKSTPYPKAKSKGQGKQPEKSTGKGQNKTSGKTIGNIKVSKFGIAFQMEDGRSLCNFFNGPNGCRDSKAAAKGRCNIGHHLCGKVLNESRVCGGNHSAQNCPGL